MKKTVLVIAMLSASSAFATSFGSGDTNINTNAPRQDQGQAQGQLQGQAQAQGQGQAQLTAVDVSNRISNDVRNRATAFSGATSSSGGNVQNTVVTDSGQMKYSGSYEVKNVPNVFSGNVYPTAPCMGSSTVGGAGVGFGFSVGTSWTDDECGIRETARSLSGLNMKDDALAVLCTSKYAAAAPACKAKE